jgi:hypothetical protein
MRAASPARRAQPATPEPSKSRSDAPRCPALRTSSNKADNAGQRLSEACRDRYRATYSGQH